MRTRQSPRNQERLWKELGGTTLKPQQRQATTIMVDNLPYQIVEHLGVQGGYKAVSVRTDSGNERIAVWTGANWRWWTAANRLGREG